MPAAYLLGPAVSSRGVSAYSCTGKIRFESAALAHAVSDRRNERLPTRRANRAQQPYRCERCGGWHIGATMRGAARVRGAGAGLIREAAAT